MRFYDALQLDPAVVKPKIRAAQTQKERWTWIMAMVLRSLLIVLFAVATIGPMGNIFGSENMPMAVALFCILLGIRFVDMNYCIGDSMINLAIVFALLLFAPVIATQLPAPLALILHFAAFFIILLMTCDKPELGNGGLYNFAYVYLTGNPVTGELLWKRAGLTLLGYVLCGAILLVKHRHNNPDVRFKHVIKNFSLSSVKCRWQLRLAVGVALVLTLGKSLGVERFMWMGFACASLLATYPYSADVKERFGHRLLGAVIGSALFVVLYQLVPDSMITLLGPVGGFCLGFCTDYRYKTAINCLGALMMAAGLYGASGSAILRVVDNVLGVLLALVIAFVYEKLVDQRFVKEENAAADASA